MLEARALAARAAQDAGVKGSTERKRPGQDSAERDRLFAELTAVQAEQADMATILAKAQADTVHYASQLQDARSQLAVARAAEEKAASETRTAEAVPPILPLAIT